MPDVKEIGLLGRSGNDWKRIAVNTSGQIVLSETSSGGGVATNVFLKSNTAKDATGDSFFLICNSDGKLIVDTQLDQEEDSAHVNNHKGIMSLAVRQDTQSNLAGDGKYSPLSINNKGELRVSGGSTRTTNNILDETISANSSSTNKFDLSNTVAIRSKLWGKSYKHNNFIIEYSDDDSSYFDIREAMVLEVNGGYIFEEVIECPPKYLRFKNITDSDHKLDIYLELIV